MDTPAIKQYVRELDPKLEEKDEAFEAAVILFAILEVGTNIKALWHFTGYDIITIHHYMKNWKANGIVEGENVYHSGWDDKDAFTGQVSFWLDVCCGMGLMVRNSA